ncbi:MAG: hypothetical protein K2O41_07500 [Clostridia bacterium]|nr:hypothetical protein [Clostridia bacterium]
MKKLVLIFRIIFCCLALAAVILFFVSYFFPDKKILLAIAYVLSITCALGLLADSLRRIINNRISIKKAKQKELQDNQNGKDGEIE